MSLRRLSVLVADDSALYRQMLQNVLQRIPGVELVGTASDGVQAVAQVLGLRPDVLTLDVQMPRLDGLGVLRELRARGSQTKAIMVSSHTDHGTPTTVEALLEGAFDFIPKPAGVDPHVARGIIHGALLEKLTAVADHVFAPASGHGVAAVTVPPRITSQGITAIAIGTSTGGPQALRMVIPALPGDLAVPLFVVQHMPSGFTGPLAARLDDLSTVRVVEAGHGMLVAPGCVYVAPGGSHLTVERTSVSMVRCGLDAVSAPRLSCRPSFDTLLESLASAYGSGLLAVVMTGMGQDGLVGCRAVKAAGGSVIAQAAAGCAIYGMPRAVTEAGLADAVVPGESLAAVMTACVRRGPTR